MRRALALLLVFLFVFCSSAFADTGTYKILDYKCKLTPTSDGLVTIDYYLKWNVTGGSIPWITVGVPNSNFAIQQEKSKGAIKKIQPTNQGSWSGVRIDLDKDYKPGETFEVFFTIQQHKLFYADNENYRMEFTPGWYDNAFIDKLTVEVFFFANIKTVKSQPPATKVLDQSFIWEKSSLGKGEHFNISVSFPKKLFPKELAKTEVNEGLSGGAILLIFIIVIVVIVVIAIAANSGGGGGYSGGGVFVGGGGGGGGGSSRHSGGGGGFGGRSSSCACACVSCACACACAGGGGAGCSRKLDHTCPRCRKKE